MFPQAVFAPVGQVSGPVHRQGDKDRGRAFVFDLDVLVPSAFGHIENRFAGYLIEFAQSHPCYLVSSATYNNVMSRLPGRVRRAFAGVFSASGAEYWEKDQLVVRTQREFSDDVYEFMVKVVQTSAYPGKSSPVLECGPASLRVCLAGTGSTAGQLKAYHSWEAENAELPAIIHEFRARFHDYAIHRESDTSLLILPAELSSEAIRDRILEQCGGSGLVVYMGPRSAEGYAKPLCDALETHDVCSVVESPGDVSQLLSYEKRCASGGELLLSLQQQLVEA